MIVAVPTRRGSFSHKAAGISSTGSINGGFAESNEGLLIVQAQAPILRQFGLTTYDYGGGLIVSLPNIWLK